MFAFCLTTLLVHSDAIRRLREMIPYWLGHCRVLIAATAEPPVFGRGPDPPERMAGIERGSNGDPKELLGLVNDEVEAAALPHQLPSPIDIGSDSG